MVSGRGAKVAGTPALSPNAVAMVRNRARSVVATSTEPSGLVARGAANGTITATDNGKVTSSGLVVGSGGATRKVVMDSSSSPAALVTVTVTGYTPPFGDRARAVLSPVPEARVVIVSGRPVASVRSSTGLAARRNTRFRSDSGSSTAST